MVKSETRPAAAGWRSPSLLAQGTVLGWCALLLVAWSVYIVVTSSAAPAGWEDLVALVGLILGLAGFVVSYLIAVVALVVMMRRPRWRQRLTSQRGGFLTGSAATAIGVSPIVLLILWGAVSNLFN